MAPSAASLRSQPSPFGSVPHSAQKEVQAVLLKQKPSRRRPGVIPYPLDYSSAMINFDNWDQMFLRSCFGGLTMHQFEPDNPPQFILDLGCGSGYWATEAARQWPNAQVVGFDLKDIQPHLFEYDAYYMRCLEDAGKSAEPLPLANELACRLKWVHGNLLDGLPFPPEHFDFVHISGVGLGVPEDEWQFVLEEVSRVLQPNGVLEIIEEDLIFPCAPPRPPRSHLAPLNFDFISRERRDSSAPPSAFSSRSSTICSDLWSGVPDSPDDTRIQKKPSLPTLQEVNTPGDSPKGRNSIPFDTGSPEASLSRQDTLFSQSQDSDSIHGASDQDHHPQDHTRLKTAWDGMLTHRFLSASVTTILPFYLSSFFENVQTHPPLQISLPPSSMAPDSGSRSSNESSFDADALFDLNAAATRPGKRLSDADVYSIKSKSTGGSSQRSVPYWGRMHLAKTVATVSACKEAIWVEYEKLYSRDLPPILLTKTVRQRHDSDARLERSKHSPREAFETDWSNWEKDMTDRIQARARVNSEFGWGEPDPSPDSRLWRTRMAPHRDEAFGVSPRPSPDLCRSLRAFVGWKPARDP